MKLRHFIPTALALLALGSPVAAQSSLAGLTVSGTAQSRVSLSNGTNMNQGWEVWVYFGQDGKRFVYLEAGQGVVIAKGKSSGRQKIGRNDITASIREGSGGFTLRAQVLDPEGVFEFQFDFSASASSCKMRSAIVTAEVGGEEADVKTSAGRCRVSSGPPF